MYVTMARVSGKAMAEVIEREEEHGEDVGVCTACGAIVEGVEPEDKGHDCGACGEPAGVGAYAMAIAMTAADFDRVLFEGRV